MTTPARATPQERLKVISAQRCFNIVNEDNESVAETPLSEESDRANAQRLVDGWNALPALAAARLALEGLLAYADLDEKRYPHAKRFSNEQGEQAVAQARHALALLRDGATTL